MGLAHPCEHGHVFPRGVTGFWSSTDTDPPVTDRRSVFQVVHEAAWAAGGHAVEVADIVDLRQGDELFPRQGDRVLDEATHLEPPLRTVDVRLLAGVDNDTVKGDVGFSRLREVAGLAGVLRRRRFGG